MPESVNVHEAKAHFSRRLERVRGEKEIVIAVSGIPASRLIPYDKNSANRFPETAYGKIRIKNNFDATSQLPLETFRFMKALLDTYTFLWRFTAQPILPQGDPSRY